MTPYRPARFRVGAMRELIDIEEFTLTKNSSGDLVRTWSDKYASVPASWMPTAGTETIRGRSVEAGVTAVFTIRFREDIDPKMRVVHSSGTYGIAYVKQVDGGRRYIELHCKQAVA